MFHQFRIMYPAKNIVRSIWAKNFDKNGAPQLFIMSLWLIPQRTNMHSSATKPPKPKIALPNDRFTINSFLSRGLSSRTASSAGSEANAMAASASITRLIHRNWVTVNGISTPISGPRTATRHAETLIDSCRKRKFLMFLNRVRPHLTPVTIDGKASSRRTMSEASLATDVPEPMAIPTSA